MRVDHWTEIIAHFIGIFDLNTEEARLRADYDKFKALGTPDSLSDLLVVDVDVPAPLDPGGFDPKVRYAPEAPDLPDLAVSPMRFTAGAPPEMGLSGQYALAPELEFSGMRGRGEAPDIPSDSDPPDRPRDSDPPGHEGTPEFPELPLPASTATIVVQDNSLIDHDVLVSDPDARFGSVEQREASVESLEDVAAGLDGPGDYVPPPDEPGVGTLAKEMAQDARDFGAPDVEGAVTHLHRDAEGSYLDGEAIDELPAWTKDLMPERASDKSSDDHDHEAPGDGDTGGADGEGPGDDGHLLNTGGNTLVNAVALASAGTAGSVVAVMGDSHTVDVISQVNVWSDTDIVSGPARVPESAAHVTKALNAADISVREASPDAVGDGLADDWPTAWVKATFEGNLINIDWARQFNFVSDHDVASVSFSGSESFIETGGDTAINAMSLVRLGLQYDLIIVEGELVNVNVVNQKNVLLDDDVVDAGAGFGGALSTNDNLLYNRAEIHKAGGETFVMSESLAGAVEEMRAGEHGIGSKFLTDEAFKGLDALRVLHVEGSMYNVRYVEQTNVLGDADQVALAAGGVMSDAMAEIKITTGANALLNLASISDHSDDSDIYVAGEQYSDALLYQASLLSDDDAPVIGDPSILANEAVAFLADGMLDDGDGDDALGSPGHSDGIAPDVMQTMLS